VFENDSGVILQKSNLSEIKQELELNQNIEAPISQNQVLGKVNFYVDNELISSVNLIAENEIEKITTFNLLKQITKSWFTILR
jgi:D-alanyl-D-alanine carboxypeptidase (penicillin-binding protein 5/6)